MAVVGVASGCAVTEDESGSVSGASATDAPHKRALVYIQTEVDGDLLNFAGLGGPAAGSMETAAKTFDSHEYAYAPQFTAADIEPSLLSESRATELEEMRKAGLVPGRNTNWPRGGRGWSGYGNVWELYVASAIARAARPYRAAGDENVDFVLAASGHSTGDSVFSMAGYNKSTFSPSLIKSLVTSDRFAPVRDDVAFFFTHTRAFFGLGCNTGHEAYLRGWADAIVAAGGGSMAGAPLLLGGFNSSTAAGAPNSMLLRNSTKAWDDAGLWTATAPTFTERWEAARAVFEQDFLGFSPVEARRAELESIFSDLESGDDARISSAMRRFSGMQQIASPAWLAIPPAGSSAALWHAGVAGQNISKLRQGLAANAVLNELIRYTNATAAGYEDPGESSGTGILRNIYSQAHMLYSLELIDIQRRCEIAATALASDTGVSYRYSKDEERAVKVPKGDLDAFRRACVDVDTGAYDAWLAAAVPNADARQSFAIRLNTSQLNARGAKQFLDQAARVLFFRKFVLEHWVDDRAGDWAPETWAKLADGAIASGKLEATVARKLAPIGEPSAEQRKAAVVTALKAMTRKELIAVADAAVASDGASAELRRFQRAIAGTLESSLGVGGNVEGGVRRVDATETPWVLTDARESD